MSNKFYQDSDLNAFFTVTYEQNQAQYYSHGPQTASQNSYNSCDFMYGQQMVVRNQSNCTPNTYFSCPDQIDNTSWFPDPKIVADIEKGLKFADKIETIEITSKDLSPASCCSNVDLFLPDSYKNINRDINYYNKPITNDSQWICNISCNTKLTDYQSCSQALNDSEEKCSKYYSVHKVPESNNFNKLLSLNSEQSELYAQSCSKNVQDKVFLPENDNQMSDYNLYNICDNRRQDILLNFGDINNGQFYSQIPFEDVNKDHHSVDCSNEESDIVVEESDEEITNFCQNIEKGCEYSTSCLICNELYTPVGSQFFILTPETPLTMCSQKPMYQKLKEIICTIEKKHSYLCNTCLGLVNTIDHLQWKLESAKTELLEKYKKTCNLKSVCLNYKKVESNIKTTPSRRKKFKNFCGMHSFKCKHCKKVFSLKKVYWSHSCKHKNICKYLCELCGRIINSYKHFQCHLARHKHLHKKAQVIQPYRCRTCHKLFRTKTNLKEHENYCSGKFPFACRHSDCDKKFATPTKLKNHIKLKHDKKFVAICSICNIGFVIVSDYKSHMVSHSTEKKYSCVKCNKTYKTLSNLNFHMKYHNDTLPFTCSICKKGFMRKEYLESHVNNHYGIKNYGCSMCDKKFVSQKSLDAHVKHHDGSVKTKMCNICGKSVVNGLEDHLRTHINLQEFECEVCNMKFNTKNTLSKHKKRKHCDKIS